METLWPVINILGPLLLIIALIWAFMRTRKRPRSEIDRAEQGARELRRELDEEEARRGDP